jgi:hypothetical protein
MIGTIADDEPSLDVARSGCRYKRPPQLLGSTALTAAPAHGRSTSRTDLNPI